MAANREEGNPRLETDSLVGLCDLPDAIQVRILSLLPTKSAVATSLLSRRWRFLWTSITNLQCSERLMFQKRRSQLINFMDRAMVLRDGSSLVSFSLLCEALGDASYINTWITKAIQCNVEELSVQLLDYDLSSDYLLSCCIFGCQSLVKLHLAMPRELSLVGCDWENTKSLRMYAPNLKVLEILSEENAYADRKVCITGDNLKSFKYEGILTNEYHICASSMHLSNVVIRVYLEDVEYDFAAERSYKILNGLSGVQNLTLIDYFLEHLEHNLELLDTIPLFECLTQLNLQYTLGEIYVDSVVLMKIYEQCPYLEYLNIEGPSSKRSQLHLVPSCFLTHLKRFTFHQYDPQGEDCAINVFLSSAAILEEMVIYCSFDAFGNGYDDDEFYSGITIGEFQDELNRRPKVSKDCRISVVYG